MKCVACGYKNNSGEWNQDALQKCEPELEKEEFIEVVGKLYIQEEPDYYIDGKK